MGIEGAIASLFQFGSSIVQNRNIKKESQYSRLRSFDPSLYQDNTPYTAIIIAAILLTAIIIILLIMYL